MSQTESTEDNPLGCLIAVAILGGGYLLLRLALFVHEATWPIWLLAALAGAGWYLTARRPGPWSQVNISILMPVSLGLGVLFFALLALNSGLFVPAATLLRWEDKLRTARLQLSEWLDLPLPVFLIGLFALILLSFLVPKLKAVSWALGFERVAYATYIVLVTVTSFTFFAQVPLQNLVEEEHAKNVQVFEEGVEQYKLLLRDENLKLTEHLAARAISEALEDLDAETVASYRAMFEAIDPMAIEELNRFSEEFAALELLEEQTQLEENLSRNHFDYELEQLRTLVEANRGIDHPAPTRKMSTDRWLPEVRSAATTALARSHAASMVASNEWKEARWNPALPEVPHTTVHWDTNKLQKPPSSLQERQEQLDLLNEQARLLEEQRRRAESAQRLAAQSREGLSAAFYKTIGLGLPEFGGLVGIYAGVVVDHLAESLFQRISETWYREGPPRIEVAVFAERMFTSLTKALGVAALLRSVRITAMGQSALFSSVSQTIRSVAQSTIQQVKHRQEERAAEVRRERIERQRVREAEVARRARSSRGRGR